MGSVLARAVIHTGLPPKRLLLRTLGSERTHQSMYLPTNLQQLAQASRVDAETLLWEHTVFPFAVAFMGRETVDQLRDRVLDRRASEPMSLGSLVRSVTACTSGLRFCPQCAQEDLHRVGESYWRRTHCLPAVHMCLRHQSRLSTASPRPRTLAQYLLTPMPHQQTVAKAQTACPAGLWVPLAKVAEATLTNKWAHREDWLENYRASALRRLYRLPGDQVAGARLAADIQHVYGSDYLAELSCDYRSPVRAWPTLMTRERPGITFAPVKHLLLDTFLKHGTPDRTIFVYQPPGKKPADLAALDQRLAAQVMKEAARLLASSETGTVTSLLEATGHWQTFRHKRKWLPLTVEQVEAFKRTDASERRAGGRLAHAKRLRAIVEGRQKPFKPWSGRPVRARLGDAQSCNDD